MELVTIVDRTMADAVRRGGDRVVCGPGCTSCCLGPVEIGADDALRLRAGLERLPPGTAAGIINRAQSYSSGQSDDDPCPALNDGLCQLYEFRPLVCRMFGPPVRIDDAIGVCELCYVGASDEEIEAAAVELPAVCMTSDTELTIAGCLAG